MCIRDRFLTFDWNGPADITWVLDPAQRDLTDDDYISLRATQAARHPATIAANGDLAFTVCLIDESDGRGFVRIDSYGGGVEEPYPRTGSGGGAGWSNEFETIRIRLDDFARDTRGLDLRRIKRVVLLFGGAEGDTTGRLVIDDLRIEKD